jgi:hypothetical protein
VSSADAISADYLVMLLSSDWFFEYWPTIGIGVAKAKKTALQNGCRSIMKQILAVNSEEAKGNLNVSFDFSRVMRARELFMDLLAKSELDCCATSTIHAALDQKKYSAKTLETLEDVTRMQLQNMLNGVPPKLEPSIKQTLHKAWKHKQTLTEGWQPIDHLDFGQLDLASSSHWDQEMRELTPDIPTCLSDQISLNNKIVSALEYIWCLASEDLNTEQKKELIDWYCAITENLTGTVLKLPCLSLPLAEVP